MRAYGKFIFATAASVALAASAQGATLLNDSFTDLDRTDGADPFDSSWYYHANAQADSVSAATGSLVLLRTGNTFGFNPHLVTQFPSQALATGDTITFSFTFRSEATAAGATAIRFGLYNSGGTIADQDIFAAGNGASPGTGTLYNDDAGYSVFAPHLGTQSFTLRARTSGGDNSTPLGTAPNGTILGTSGATTATTTAGFYTPSIELTRTASGYDYAIDYNGTLLVGSTTNVTTSIFDSLSIFAINEENQPFTIDDVMVTYTAVPEPAALSLVALGALAIVGRRRV